MMKGFLCCSLKTGSLILAVFNFVSIFFLLFKLLLKAILSNILEFRIESNFNTFIHYKNKYLKTLKTVKDNRTVCFFLLVAISYIIYFHVNSSVFIIIKDTTIIKI